MSSVKAKKATATVDLPECPVCMEMMTAPIFQCQSGHSLCNECTKRLCPPVCPICRQPMTQMRNWQLEDIVLRAKVPCPNKSLGCLCTMVNSDVGDHLKECIFREMECPLGAVSGKCSWHGKLKEIMDHFKKRHANHCNTKPDTEIVLNGISMKDDDRYFYLVSQGKLLFIVTMKLDTVQKMAYWTVQHIGSKSVAQQYMYIIVLKSNQDEKKIVLFTERCFNDAIKADDLFRMGKCAVLPLNVLEHFIKGKKLTFLFVIKKDPPAQSKGAKLKGDVKNENKPGNKGPKGLVQKGPGPKTAGPKVQDGLGPKPAGTNIQDSLDPTPAGSKIRGSLDSNPAGSKVQDSLDPKPAGSKVQDSLDPKPAGSKVQDAGPSVKLPPFVLPRNPPANYLRDLLDYQIKHLYKELNKRK